MSRATASQVVGVGQALAGDAEGACERVEATERVGQGGGEERDGGGWIAIAVEEEALAGASEEPRGAKEGYGECGA